MVQWRPAVVGRHVYVRAFPEQGDNHLGFSLPCRAQQVPINLHRAPIDERVDIWRGRRLLRHCSDIGSALLVIASQPSGKQAFHGRRILVATRAAFTLRAWRKLFVSPEDDAASRRAFCVDSTRCICAQSSGVMPFVSLAFKSAPASISVSTVSVCAQLAAQCSGVHLFQSSRLSLAFTFAPFSMRAITLFVLPYAAASISFWLRRVSLYLLNMFDNLEIKIILQYLICI